MTIAADTVFGIPLFPTRNVEIGAPLYVDADPSHTLLPGVAQTLYIHPLDHWRLRNWEEQAGLSDLEVLERWYVEEVDRRLKAIGLYPPKPTVTYSSEPPTPEQRRGPHVEGSTFYVVGSSWIFLAYRWERRDGVLDWHPIRLERPLGPRAA